MMANLWVSLMFAAAVPLQTDGHMTLREAARLEQAGDTAGALDAYARTLGESAPGSMDRASILVAMAGLETDLGKYAESRRHSDEAAGIFKALGHSSGLASALNRSGLAALYLGDYGKAEQAFRSAAHLSIELGDADGRAEQLANLGNVHFFVGRYAEAAREYDEALAVTTASASEAWAPRRRRIILVNQATLYQRLGRDQQALALYQELGATRTELRPDEQAQMLANLGVLYRRLGDPIKALTTYDKARTLFARDRHVDGEIGVLKNRGIVLAMDLGRLDEAEQTFSEALDAAVNVGDRREMLHARLYRGETRLRAGRRDRADEDFAAGLVLARELRTPEEEWKALFGLARAESTARAASRYLEQAVSTIEQVRESIRVPLMRSDFLNDKREVYDALIAAHVDAASAERLFNLIEQSHSRVWRERLGLARSADLKSVQRALPAGVLLLDYWSSSRGSAAIVVSRLRSGVIRVRVDDGQIKALIDALASGPSSRWQKLAAGLGSELLPSAEWFDGADHVLIVTDGPMALVPFELLSTGGRLLIERAAVTYLPTATTLLRSPPPRPMLMPPWRLELRAFADPVFASARADNGEGVRGRVRESAGEVRHIAAELAGGAALHIGEENRKAYLLSTAEPAPILHLATHAMADANAMEQSRIMFSPAVGSDSSADYLFLKEAYELPLDGVELAVLSACDTERGRFVRGEGVQSFSRAFLAAGARSTVTTLWRVADQPTADFMQLFYHHLQRGIPKDEALRRAKLRFLRSDSGLADPHFWAAFVLTGDGLRPVPRAISWTAISIATLTVPALAFAALRLRRRGQPPIQPT